MNTFKNHSLSLVLSSCDSYKDAWKPFCHQIKACWPEFNMPIYLNSENEEFHYESFDVRCPFAGKQLKFKEWSDRLIKLLEQIPDEFVLFMLDDFWLTEKVDHKRFKDILTIMESDEKIGFICLRRESNPGGQDCEYPLLRESSKKKIFRITTQAGLWRRKYLIKILRAHESVWYFETRATFRSKYCREKVYDVKQTLLTYPIGGFLGGGKCYADYLEYYPAEIVKECVEKRGLINFGDLRSYPGIKKGLSYYISILKSITPKF